MCGSNNFMFLGGLKQCHFDSRLAFKGIIDSRDLRSRRHDFGGSPRTKVMTFHAFNFPLFSLLIFIFFVFMRSQNHSFY